LFICANQEILYTNVVFIYAYSPALQCKKHYTVKGPEVKYHLTHKMTNKLHNYPVKLHLRRICHISFTKRQMRFTVTLNDIYASGKASQDNCEAYLSFCELNDTLPRDPFTVQIAFYLATFHG
jgi:hypothetical protein